MERVEKSVEVAAPLRAVYNQWTQFEEWPRFMAGVKEVRQLDDTHLHWHAEVWGKDKEWDAEITEQVPDQVIAWRSTSAAPRPAAGAARCTAGRRRLIHSGKDQADPDNQQHPVAGRERGQAMEDIV